MLTKLFGLDTGQRVDMPKEGDLFKVIELYGTTFEIRYGFYEDRDRHNRYAEPMEIYPDFIKNPQHTHDGMPFVTAMQTPCALFKGKKDEDSTCDDCAFYQHCEEMLGICVCPKNKKEVV